MFFLNMPESIPYFEGLKLGDSLKNYDLMSRDGHQNGNIKYSSVKNNINGLFKIIANAGYKSSWSILLITDWDIFPSSVDQNLIYSFRHSKGEYRHLHEAPGHLFLDYEEHEIATLLTICFLNFYDAFLISQNDFSRFHLSHDEFIDYYTNDIELQNSLKKYSES